jgi:hypothetical protein
MRFNNDDYLRAFPRSERPAPAADPKPEAGSVTDPEPEPAPVRDPEPEAEPIVLDAPAADPEAEEVV